MKRGVVELTLNAEAEALVAWLVVKRKLSGRSKPDAPDRRDEDSGAVYRQFRGRMK